MMLGSAVKPLGRRRVFHPRMQRPDMVRYRIKKHLHVLLVRCLHKFLIIPQRPEMGINRVQVHCAIAVVIPRRAIFQDGGKPDGCYTEFLYVWQVSLYSTQVATMIGPRIGSV